MGAFKVKNGLQALRYLGSSGVETAGTGVSLGDTAYASKSFSVGSQGGSPYGMHIGNSGAKMYVVDFDNRDVYQYTLSVAYDVSSASYDSVLLDVSSYTLRASDMTFSDDGTKTYVLDDTNKRLHQFNLSTAWDLSSASYYNFFGGIDPESIPFSDVRACAFANSGTKLYIANLAGSQEVFQFTLSTAWDVTTASYDSKKFSVSSQETGAHGLALVDSGSTLYVSGTASDSIHQYTLSTPYDISTATFDNISVSVASQDIAPTALFVEESQGLIYIAGNVANSVFQYNAVAYTQTLDLSTGTYFSFTPSGATTVSFTNAPASGKAVGFAVEINGDGSAITWPSSVKWHEATAPTATATKELYTFVTTDGGTTYYGKRAAEGVA
jgi:sugar lactone lactonase YvrE